MAHAKQGAIPPEWQDLACPFFMPTRRLEGPWRYPLRLPLGGGWHGYCTAPGHEGAIPEEAQLHAGCNLGYAAECFRLPEKRASDAVRFSVVRADERQVILCYVCEVAHRPGQDGQLAYDRDTEHWSQPHADPRMQRMAECFLDSYLRKIGSIAATG